MMKFSQMPVSAQDIYYCIFAVTVMLTLFGFVMSLVCKTRKSILITNSAMLVVEFIFFSFLYEGYGIIHSANGGEISTAGKAFYDMPSPVAWTVLAVYLTLTAFCVVYCVWWNKRHVGKTSIKEGMDKMPVGLCFYAKNGMPILTNDEMNKVCVALTGHTVMDGNALWQTITEGADRNGNRFIISGDTPIIKLSDGKIKSFIRREIDDAVTELIATDVTMQYELGEKLAEENEELKTMNARLAEYGNNIVAITRENEILATKIRIHDDIGHLLLALKKSLLIGASREEKEFLLSEWLKVAKLLASENEQFNMREKLFSYAKTLGIRLEINGEIPQEKRLSDVMFVAVKECLTNTLAHAKGNVLTVVVKEADKEYEMACTNNGCIPTEPITEGGGLSSLRNITERAGGTMTVAIEPRFILSIVLPKEGV